MTFFEFLDNRFRNKSLDRQINDTLDQDGMQRACHTWVLYIRKFYTVLYFVLLPGVFLLKKLRVVSQDADYNLRFEDIRAYTEKTLKAAREAEKAGEPCPDPNASKVIAINENN